MIHEQLTLFNKAVASERADQITVPVAVPARWTAPYRCVRGGWYYRFYWQQRDKSGRWQTRHVHIRGGNSDNPVAIANRVMVDAAILRGATNEEIRLLIRDCNRHIGNYRKTCNPV